MRQIICIHLPSLPIDLAIRKNHSLRDKPFVLVESTANRVTVVHSSPLAQRYAIRPGLLLAAARSRCNDLIALPLDQTQIENGFHALARWMVRFTPVVTIEMPAIIAEIGGSLRALGSIEVITNNIRMRLAANGISAHVAIAPTIGAAWALASSGRNCIGNIDSLNNLPVSTLRASHDTVIRLQQVGIETIGQLRQMYRRDLHARFGDEILLRLDQAIGTISEPIIPLEDEELISANIQSEEPVTTIEAIWDAIHDLTEQITIKLSELNQGLCKLKITLQPAYANAIEKTLRFSRPTHEVKNIFRLICLSLENLHSREGFISIELKVLRKQKILQRQRDFVGENQDRRDSELGDLVDGLQARLGEQAVLCPQLIESHLPERACSWTPWPGETSSALLTCPRPMQLDQPAEIQVIVSPSEDREGNPIAFRYRNQFYPIRYCIGPERISGQWWEGHARTRDYFDVEVDTGQRFWIFRVLESFKWYLHGTF